MPLPPLIRSGITQRSILNTVRSQMYNGNRARQFAAVDATYFYSRKVWTFVYPCFYSVNIFQSDFREVYSAKT